MDKFGIYLFLWKLQEKSPCMILRKREGGRLVFLKKKDKKSTDGENSVEIISETDSKVINLVDGLQGDAKETNGEELVETTEKTGEQTSDGETSQTNEAAENKNPDKEEKAKKEKKPKKPKPRRNHTYMERKVKSSRRRTFLFLFLFLSLVISFYGAEIYEDSPYTRLKTAISEERIEEAVLLYNEEVQLSFLWQSKGLNLLETYVDGVDGLADLQRKTEVLSLLSQVNDRGLQEKIQEKTTKLTEDQAYSEAFSEVERLIQEEQEEEAMAFCQELLESEDSAEISGLLTMAQDAYRERILAGVSLDEAEESYLSSVELLEKALKILPNDEVLLKKVDELGIDFSETQRREGIVKMVSFAEGENLTMALEQLAILEEEYPEDEKISLALADLSPILEEKTSQKVSEALLFSEFDEIRQWLTLVQELLPNSEKIKEETWRLQENGPTALSNVPADELNHVLLLNMESRVIDVNGGSHDPTNSYMMGQQNSMGKFLLNGEYSRFTFDLAVYSDHSEKNQPVKFTIYDNEYRILLQVGNISYDSPVISYNVNVSGAEHLFICTDNLGEWPMSVSPLLVNGYFIK